MICESERLLLRLTRREDAAFLLKIVNQDSWIRNIGDRKVHTIEDAERYVDTRMLEPVRKHGFGMYVIELKQTGAAVGLCGLVKRDTLPDPDLGFALLDEHAGHGYAREAAAMMLRHARDTLKLPRLLAIVSPANTRSSKLLLKLGFRLDPAPHVNPEGEHLNLYSVFGR